jgi:hypothetical protein
MARIICFLTLLFSAKVLVLAQAENTKPCFAGISYFSEGGLYPGFTFNYERLLLSNKNAELVVGAKAGAYFHYRNHTGIFFLIQSGQRYRLVHNLYIEHFLGVGYLHSFLSGGDAYYVDATGMVHKASKKGNAHFMPSVSAGLSYHFNQKKEYWVFGRPMLFWQIPFNNASLLQFGLEIGVNAKIK